MYLQQEIVLGKIGSQMVKGHRRIWDCPQYCSPLPAGAWEFSCQGMHKIMPHHAASSNHGSNPGLERLQPSHHTPTNAVQAGWPQLAGVCGWRIFGTKTFKCKEVAGTQYGKEYREPSIPQEGPPWNEHITRFIIKAHTRYRKRG